MTSLYLSLGSGPCGRTAEVRPQGPDACRWDATRRKDVRREPLCRRRAGFAERSKPGNSAMFPCRPSPKPANASVSCAKFDRRPVRFPPPSADSPANRAAFGQKTAATDSAAGYRGNFTPSRPACPVPPDKVRPTAYPPCAHVCAARIGGKSASSFSRANWSNCKLPLRKGLQLCGRWNVGSG